MTWLGLRPCLRLLTSWLFVRIQVLEELLVHAWLEGSVQDIRRVVINRAFKKNPLCAAMMEVRNGGGGAGGR